MTDDARTLEDLAGEGGDAADRERLSHVHALMLEAGQAPVPSRSLLPPHESRRRQRPRTRVMLAGAVGAVALVAASIGVGYALHGDALGGKAVEQILPMRGPSGATAELAVFNRDAAGNWPMSLSLSGLPPLPRGHKYELWLTRDGRLVDSCGTFVVSGGSNRGIWLNAPYDLRRYDGWVIVAEGSRTPLLSTA